MSQSLQTTIAPERVAKINLYHRAGRNAAVSLKLYALLIGNELNTIKKEMPHGQFMPFVKDNFEFSYDTANNYMGFAKGIKDGVKFGTVPNLKLLDLPLDKQDPKQVDALGKNLEAKTAGASFKQVLFDLGVMKEPHTLTGGNTGNYKTGPREKANLDEQLKATTKTAIEDLGFACSRLESCDWMLLSDPQLNAVLATIDATNRAMKKWLGLTKAQRNEQHEDMRKAMKNLTKL